MSKQILAIAIRIAAIFVFLYGLRSVGNYMPMLMDERDYFADSRWFVWWLMVLPFVVAFLLWIFPLIVAGKLLPRVESKETLFQVPIDQLQTTAFSIVGVALLAYALPDLLYWAIYLYKSSKLQPNNEPISAEYFAAIVTTLLEVAIGLWLLFGARGLLGVIRKVREAGLDR